MCLASGAITKKVTLQYLAALASTNNMKGQVTITKASSIDEVKMPLFSLFESGVAC